SGGSDAEFLENFPLDIARQYIYKCGYEEVWKRGRAGPGLQGTLGRQAAPDPRAPEGARRIVLLARRARRDGPLRLRPRGRARRLAIRRLPPHGRPLPRRSRPPREARPLDVLQPQRAGARAARRNRRKGDLTRRRSKWNPRSTSHSMF